MDGCIKHWPGPSVHPSYTATRDMSRSQTFHSTVVANDHRSCRSSMAAA